MKAEFELIQRELNDWVAAHGSFSSYPNICHLIARKNRISIQPELHRDALEALDEQGFLDYLPHRPCELFGTEVKDTPEVTEVHFYGGLDVNVIQQFFQISDNVHRHDCFEITYVYRGKCELGFESETRTMTEGEMCIMAPGGWHRLRIPSASCIVFLITIRKSTFQETFFRLLTQNNLLADFFRMVLYSEKHVNYLLFFTGNTPMIRRIVQDIVTNSVNQDDYSNELLISYVNIFFGHVLRNFSKSIQYYNSGQDNDVPLMLQYIRRNYQQLSLSQLAELFHYNVSYLSVMLKKNTGKNFSQIINEIRMDKAKELLAATTLRVSAVAERTGFQSPDAFTKVFQKHFGETPSDFRKRQEAASKGE